jgi:hypothetical protein
LSTKRYRRQILVEKILFLEFQNVKNIQDIRCIGSKIKRKKLSTQKIPPTKFGREKFFLGFLLNLKICRGRKYRRLNFSTIKKNLYENLKLHKKLFKVLLK